VLRLSVYAPPRQLELSSSCILCVIAITARLRDRIFAPNSVVDFLSVAVRSDSIPVDSVDDQTEVNAVEEPRKHNISVNRCHCTDYAHDDSDLPRQRREFCCHLYKPPSAHHALQKLAIRVTMIEVVREDLEKRDSI
jgi:hypothetical protein